MPPKKTLAAQRYNSAASKPIITNVCVACVKLYKAGAYDTHCAVPDKKLIIAIKIAGVQVSHCGNCSLRNKDCFIVSFRGIMARNELLIVNQVPNQLDSRLTAFNTALTALKAGVTNQNLAVFEKADDVANLTLTYSLSIFWDTFQFAFLYFCVETRRRTLENFSEIFRAPKPVKASLSKTQIVMHGTNGLKEVMEKDRA
jgi:hypothetical protein